MKFCLIGIIFLNIFQSYYAKDGPTVSLPEGNIEGFETTSSKGNKILSFLSIPYAASPIGNLRFKDPSDPEPWKDVRSGNDLPSPCPQIDFFALLRMGTSRYIGNEDCLYLNVYTPKVFTGTLPVMVYIHGGAFFAGAGTWFEPNELLNEDVILVTVNYRLGIMGFLSTGDSVISGNYGLKDQTKALKWVANNIHLFGGDPKKVTIFGMSAGGASVDFHTLSKHSAGLFSRAIIQSGTLLCPWAMARSDVRESALMIGNHFKCFQNTPKDLKAIEKSHLLLTCLMGIDTETLALSILKTFKWSFFPLLFGPYVDGDFIQTSPEELLKSKETTPIDVIYGVNRDEGALISNGLLAYEEQRQAIKSDFPVIGPISLGLENEDRGMNISQLAYDYFIGGVKNDENSFNSLTKMFGDRHFSVCSDWRALFQAEANEGSDQRVYFYELHHRGQRSLSDPMNVSFGKHWINHGDEIMYLFPMPMFGSTDRNEEDTKLRDIFTKLWTNFAKTGNPTPDASLDFKWQPFTTKSPDHLQIDLSPKMKKDHRKQIRDIWQSLSTKQNEILFEKEFVREEL